MQRTKIAAICTAQDYALAGIYSEPGISGSIPFGVRPEGAALLAAVKRGDVIVCLKLDRAFRDTLDALTTHKRLEDRGVGLHLCDLGGDVCSSPMHKMIFTNMSAFATFERSRIGERIADAKRHQRAQGRHMGGARVAFGFTKVDRREPGAAKPRWYLAPIPEILDQAKRMKADGVSLRTAAEAFRAMGHEVSHVGVQSLFRVV